MTAPFVFNESVDFSYTVGQSVVWNASKIVELVCSRFNNHILFVSTFVLMIAVFGLVLCFLVTGVKGLEAQKLVLYGKETDYKVVFMFLMTLFAITIIMASVIISYFVR